MDKREIPPWVKHIWYELTKPPAVLNTRPHAQPPADESGSAAPAHDVSFDPSESPSDPPPQRRPQGGSPQVIASVARRYFTPRKTARRPSTRPRPRASFRRAKKRRSTQSAHITPHAQLVHTADQSSMTRDTSQTITSANWIETVNRPFMQAFDETITSVEAVNGVWRVTTSGGRIIALKSARISSARIHFLADATSYVYQHGFINLARIIRTQSGEPSLSTPECVYYASEWIKGRPVNFRSTRLVGATARSLARFHEASKGFSPSHYRPPSAFALHEQMLTRSQDLIRIGQLLEARTTLDTFDQEVQTYLPTAQKGANVALSLLQLPEAEKAIQIAKEHPGLCHLDVTPKNLIAQETGTVYLIDFDLMTYGPRVLDLAHLIRRAMQAQNAWTSETALAPLIAYNRVQPLSQGEYILLEALLTFPFRFWRLTTDYYNHSQISADSLSRLRKALVLEGEREQFLETFARQVTRHIHPKS